jgi:hypothetical protein
MVERATAKRTTAIRGVANASETAISPLILAGMRIHIFALSVLDNSRMHSPMLFPSFLSSSNRREFFRLSGGIALGALASQNVQAQANDALDVCVYCANASGVMAAVAAAREGATVLLIEPSRWLGGMTGGGLMHVDWGRQEAVGGSTRGLLKSGHNDPEYRNLFSKVLEEQHITVLFEHRVTSVEREGATIRAITLDYAPPDSLGCPISKPTQAAARKVVAKVFIDCSYEGDLMARAGVTYTFGREARDTYGESLAGVQANLATYDIDPYVVVGDPKSGLLPLLQDITMPPEGSADRLTMGYGFRWKFSKDPERLPIEPPEAYDPRTFELYRRAFLGNVDIFSGRRMRKLGEFEHAGGGIYSIGMGNLARALWAPTVYGSNAAYPDGDYATRARLWKEQQDFMRGLTYFLRTDDSAPAKWKEQALGIGFQPGIFDDTNGWPHQLYVREARRMVASYVVTQKDMEGATDIDDAVGLASYGVDEWPYATFADSGRVSLQGGFYSMLYLEEAHRGIYKIPYRSITPKLNECNNLLVPVCVSASHIAMTSIRMEPVWMILGESAGVAAALAVREKIPVQRVEYAKLRSKLVALHQKLDRP